MNMDDDMGSNNGGLFFFIDGFMEFSFSSFLI